MTGCDPKLLPDDRFRTAIRADRALKRVYLVVELVLAVAVPPFVILRLILEGASPWEWLRSILQSIGAGVGFLAIGLVPALIALLWVNTFPESWLGDDVLFWRKKRPHRGSVPMNAYQNPGIERHDQFRSS